MTLAHNGRIAVSCGSEASRIDLFRMRLGASLSNQAGRSINACFCRGFISLSWFCHVACGVSSTTW